MYAGVCEGASCRASQEQDMHTHVYIERERERERERNIYLHINLCIFKYVCMYNMYVAILLQDSIHKNERVSVAGCIWMMSSVLAGGEEGGGGRLSSGKPLCATALLWFAACPRVWPQKTADESREVQETTTTCTRIFTWKLKNSDMRASMRPETSAKLPSTTR